MNQIKQKFLENEWNMIEHILSNGRTQTWYELGLAFNIRRGANREQIKKATNDVWRKYQSLLGNGRTTNIPEQVEQPRVAKVLIYDIETSRMEANVWWSGKQFVRGTQLTTDSRIITVAYKWLGEDEIHYLKWNKHQSDKKLVKRFLEVYNEADYVIGFNNNNFDNRYVNARALKYGFEVNTHVKSLDLMKEAKRLFKIPSYSLDFIARYVGVPTKLQHSGIAMWEAIQYGSKKEAKEAMELMIEYNIQDIIVTESVFLKLAKYIKLPTHVGVLMDKEKTTCPLCGGTNVELYKTTVTSSGTIQRVMRCKDDGHLFKISNSQYLKM